MSRFKSLPLVLSFCAVALFSFITGNDVRAEEVSARLTSLESSINQAISVLLEPELQGEDKSEQRREKLREVLYPQFDFDRMASGSVGRKWRKFSPEQQARFTVLFKKLLEKTYLGMIERYQGEQVNFVKEVELSEDVVRIDSIILSKGQKYDMSYRLGRDGEQWRVFDVIIEGVSVIANYRAQFKQLLRDREPDIDGMFAKLEAKVSE
ncbi:MAG: ABC transporter substrate-binding protein [Magnetococcales bacterium]|nr:ABC transporter substrate-binding protein [Magnetococcales bacterium]